MCKYIFKINLVNGNFIKILFAGLIMGLILLLLKVPLWLNICVGGITYSLLVLILGVISIKDINLIKDLLPTKNNE